MIHTIQYGSSYKTFTISDAELQPYLLSGGISIVTKKSINRYFGQASKTDWLNEFMHSFSRYGIGATGLLEKLTQPIQFELLRPDGIPTIEEGYDVPTILAACEFLIFAKTEGFLSVIELKFAKAAQTMLDEHLKNPLTSRILETTGFNFTKEKAQQKIMESFVDYYRDGVYKWIVAFTDEFWTMLMSDLQTDWKSIVENPFPAATFSKDWIFSRISAELLDNLRSNAPKRSYRSKNGPQRNEHPQLSAYLHGLTALYAVSGGHLGILDQLLSKSDPVRRTIAVKTPEVAEALPPFSLQIKNVLTAVK